MYSFKKASLRFSLRFSTSLLYFNGLQQGGDYYKSAALPTELRQQNFFKMNPFITKFY